jgi:hypothetical protein
MTRLISSRPIGLTEIFWNVGRAVPLRRGQKFALGYLAANAKQRKHGTQTNLIQKPSATPSYFGTLCIDCSTSTR